MANNPSETPLTRGEKLTLSIVATAFISSLVTVGLFFCLSLLGPRPTPWMIGAACLLGLSAGVLWVRPWRPGPPPKR